MNINNLYFDNMVRKINHAELQLKKSNTSDTEASFLDLHLYIPDDIVSTKVSLLYMVIFLALHPMEFIFINSFDLLEHLAMLLTSTIAINC